MTFNGFIAALWARLDAVATAQGATGVFAGREGGIPQGTGYPAYLFAYSGGGEENETPERSIDLVYIVKVVSDVSLKEARAHHAAIFADLNGSELSISGWDVFWQHKDTANDIEYVDTTQENQVFYHAGAHYRFRLEKQ